MRAMMTPSLRGFLRNQTTVRTSDAPELLAALTPDSFGIFVVEHPTVQQLHRMSAYNRMGLLKIADRDIIVCPSWDFGPFWDIDFVFIERPSGTRRKRR